MSEQITVDQLRPHYIADDKNTAYYDTIFTKILAGNIWQANFVSAFFPLPWMLYRRMYAAAFIYNIVVSVILNMIPKDYIPVFMPINILIMLFSGNLIYFHTLKRRIGKEPSFKNTDNQTCIIYLVASVAISILAQRENALVYAIEIIFWVWVYLVRRKDIPSAR